MKRCPLCKEPNSGGKRSMKNGISNGCRLIHWASVFHQRYALFHAAVWLFPFTARRLLFATEPTRMRCGEDCWLLLLFCKMFLWGS